MAGPDDAFAENAWPRRDFQDDHRHASNVTATRERPPGAYSSDWRGDISARDSMHRYVKDSPGREFGAPPMPPPMPPPGSAHDVRAPGVGYQATDDQSDRTYGTRIGQGLSAPPEPAEWRPALPLTQRIGAFVRGVFGRGRDRNRRKR